MDKVIDHYTPRGAAESHIRAQQGDGETLRETAMRAIAGTRFVPPKGRNRIGSLVEGRPDWVLSRQRAWGVPITLFVHRQSGPSLIATAVTDRLVAAVKDSRRAHWSDAPPRPDERRLRKGYFSPSQ